jgi:Sad1 / UNC-like C-terminal
LSRSQKRNEQKEQNDNDEEEERIEPAQSEPERLKVSSVPSPQKEQEEQEVVEEEKEEGEKEKDVIDNDKEEIELNNSNVEWWTLSKSKLERVLLGLTIFTSILTAMDVSFLVRLRRFMTDASKLPVLFALALCSVLFFVFLIASPMRVAGVGDGDVRQLADSPTASAQVRELRAEMDSVAAALRRDLGSANAGLAKLMERIDENKARADDAVATLRRAHDDGGDIVAMHSHQIREWSEQWAGEVRRIDAKLAELPESVRDIVKQEVVAGSPAGGAAPLSDDTLWADVVTSQRERIERWIDDAQPLGDARARLADVDARLAGYATRFDEIEASIEAYRSASTTRASDERRAAEQWREGAEKRERDAASSAEARFKHADGELSSLASIAERAAKDAASALAASASGGAPAASRADDERVQRADFALAKAGAMVVHSLTSPTFGDPLAPLGAIGRGIAGIAGGAMHNHPPELALTSSLEPGDCWPMAGARGNLTVRLARAIVPQQVSIGHIAERNAIFAERSSAPRTFDVWALRIDSAEPAERTPRLLISGATYDLSAGAIQVFDIERTSQRALIDTVILDVTSNHGHRDFTCLYRFAVHGSS